MDKNQALKVVKTYLYEEPFLPRAKKELKEIKKINDLEEQRKRANIAYNYHTTYSQLVASHVKNYNLLGEINNVAEYEGIVDELHGIKIKGNEKDKTFNWKDEEKYSCELCKQTKVGQYWCPTFKGRQPVSMGGDQKKFCSQACLNSWNHNNSKEQNNKKCASCSTLLTTDEICYCATCSAQQEQIRKNLDKNSQDINNMVNDFNQGLNDDKRERERERERAERQGVHSEPSGLKGQREQLQSQQSQLRSQITTLEQNPSNLENQAELKSKRKKLKELEEKEKELTKSLPLTTQISNLEKEIKELENRSNRSQAEEELLSEKEKKLEELLRKQNSSNNNKPSDKIILYIGLGIIGLFTLLLIFILVRNHQRRKKI